LKAEKGGDPLEGRGEDLVFPKGGGKRGKSPSSLLRKENGQKAPSKGGKKRGGAGCSKKGKGGLPSH